MRWAAVTNNDTATAEENDKITHFPDKILVSPVAQYDTLPISSYIDIQKN